MVCGRNGNLKISTVLHTAGTSSVRYAKMPSSSKRRKEEKRKREKRQISQIFRKNLGVFVVFVIHDLSKRNKKKMFKRKVLPGFEPG